VSGNGFAPANFTGPFVRFRFQIDLLGGDSE
jgi:hypothetical protein